MHGKAVSASCYSSWLGSWHAPPAIRRYVRPFSATDLSWVCSNWLPWTLKKPTGMGPVYSVLVSLVGQLP